MATVPLPPGTKNLTVNVEIPLHQELLRHAKRNRVTLSEFVRRILTYAASHDALLKDGVEFSNVALNETKSPPPPPPVPPPKGHTTYRHK